MPVKSYVLMLGGVITAAGLTVWLGSLLRQETGAVWPISMGVVLVVVLALRWGSHLIKGGRK